MSYVTRLERSIESGDLNVRRERGIDCSIGLQAHQSSSPPQQTRIDPFDSLTSFSDGPETGRVRDEGGINGAIGIEASQTNLMEFRRPQS
jgi:hypothetical protein